jgi:hypothetical protein
MVSHNRHVRIALALVALLAASDLPPQDRGETFVGTTPATPELLRSLGAPGADAELIEWTVSLQGSGVYAVNATVGLTQPNMPGVARNKRNVETSGKWTRGKATRSDPRGDVIALGNLSFVRIGPSIIHVLAADGSLMAGNGGWSYSLNRSDKAEPFVDPRLAAQAPEMSYTISAVSTGPSVYGVFEGRTPCQGVARAIGMTVHPSCAKVKWRVTLYQDPQTRTPSTYKVEGSLYRANSIEGRWTISPATPGGHSLIRLESSATFIKADEDVLLFADREGTPLVGHAAFSYTLDRRKGR